MPFATWSDLYRQMQDDIAEYLANGSWQTKRYRIGDQEHELNRPESFMKWFRFFEKRACRQLRRTYAKNARRFS